MSNFDLNAKVSEFVKECTTDAKTNALIKRVVAENNNSGQELKALLMALNDGSEQLNKVGLITAVKESSTNAGQYLAKLHVIVKPQMIQSILKVKQKINLFNFWINIEKDAYKVGEIVELQGSKFTVLTRIKLFNNGHINTNAIMCDSERLINIASEQHAKGLARKERTAIGDIYYMAPNAKDVREITEAVNNNNSLRNEAEMAFIKCGYSIDDYINTVDINTGVILP